MSGLRRGLLLALAVVLALGACGLIGVTAASGDTRPPTTTASTDTTYVPTPKGVGHIILPPNYGHKPTNPADRGGWQQSMVFWLVLASLVIVVLLVWRSSRRALRSGAGPVVEE